MLPSLRERSRALAGCLLLLATALIVPLLEAARLPAAFLLGALAAAILLAALEARIAVFSPLFVASEALIGCMIARALKVPTLLALSDHWPLFLGATVAVLSASTLLSLLLVRWRVLPGNTAIWGSFPGAAVVMTLMAEAYGEDVRLVAFMQYLRVVCVAIAASLMARLSGGVAASTAVSWFPPLDAQALLATLLTAGACAWVGGKTRLPAGPLLLPMIVCTVLQDAGLIKIELPPWLLAASYAVVGWSIGLRFTRSILRHVARALPQVLGSIIGLIVVCAGLGVVLAAVCGLDPLSAVLATTPGGADAVAIIAASSHVDLPFVVAMQTARFVIILALGPVLARFMARRITRTKGRSA